jgi:hypothetical protein
VAESPGVAYGQRLESRRSAAAALAQQERWVSRARAAAFLTGVALIWTSIDWHAPPLYWALAPLAVFVALVIRHHQLRSARVRNDRAIAYYERAQARLEDRWVGGGEQGERFRDDSHPYAEDLDLFGRGSLFELLCTARTRAGEETLARWLCSPAPPDEAAGRQQAVAELAPRLDLREDLAAIGIDVRSALDPDALAAWGAAPPLFRSRALRLVAAALPLVLLASAWAWAEGVLAARIPLLMLTAQVLFAAALRPRVLRVIRAVDRPARDLRLLSHLLGRLEQERFESQRLSELRAALDTAGLPPSSQIARLSRRIDWLYARNNELFAPVSALFLWATQFALAIESWRVANGAGIARWLAVVGEIEALCSLGVYAYEHPNNPFPKFVESGPRFEAEALGHPLLPAERCIRNDVHLGDGVRVLIVSGSNMSGKSTLLRSVGTNTVLALMGAPVCARRLRLSELVVGASIRTNDSLQAGTSRFYAEITRLRQLMDLTQVGVPLLFLLDEILHGTNSHDRRIGAAAVVRGLLLRNAVGLVTTHDLALAQIADGEPRALNVHFEDQLDGDSIRFDYRLRPGVVSKSNALALMRMVGLEV